MRKSSIFLKIITYHSQSRQDPYTDPVRIFWIRIRRKWSGSRSLKSQYTSFFSLLPSTSSRVKTLMDSSMLPSPSRPSPPSSTPIGITSPLTITHQSAHKCKMNLHISISIKCEISGKFTRNIYIYMELRIYNSFRNAHKYKDLLRSLYLNHCCGSEIIFFRSGSDFSGNFGSGSSPDPEPIPDTTQFLSEEAKAKILNKTAAQILILKKIFLKLEIHTCEFFTLQ